MSARRPLGETLSEVAAGAMEALSVGGGFLTAREVTVVLPLEVVLARTPAGVAVLGDLPRTVTRTDFDVTPARLELLCRGEARP